MEGGILFTTNDLVIIFTPPPFFLCPMADCAHLRAPTVTDLSTNCYRQCPSEQPCVSVVSVVSCLYRGVYGYGPSKRGAGLKDACVCGCESLCLIPHKGCTSNKWVCFLTLNQQQRICPICVWAVASQWWAWAPFQMVKGCLCFFFCELSTHVLCLFFFWVLTLPLRLQEFFLS